MFIFDFIFYALLSIVILVCFLIALSFTDNSLETKNIRENIKAIGANSQDELLKGRIIFNFNLVFFGAIVIMIAESLNNMFYPLPMFVVDAILFLFMITALYSQKKIDANEKENKIIKDMLYKALGLSFSNEQPQNKEISAK